MATLEQLALIAQDINFQQRCYTAMIAPAQNVESEASSTTGHAQRSAYAQLVINGNANGMAMAREILNNATIAGEADITQTANAGYGIPDSDIAFVVTQVFNALAGYDPN